MEKTLKIQVREKNSGEVLLEVPLAQEEEAYAYSLEMEKLGLEVEVFTPTVLAQLGHSLGQGVDQLAAFHASVDEELEEHDGRDQCRPPLKP